jgi:hypothetical protein
MSASETGGRRFFHSFPRAKAGETADDTLQRGVRILQSMKEVGLVLAPEIVEWGLGALTSGREQLSMLQRRASFTELSPSELVEHSKTFGPLSLSFDIGMLRGAGATPVIYVPQGVTGSALSQIGTFCVRGAYHTRHVLRQLQDLKAWSDPDIVAKRKGMHVDSDFKLTLQNTNSANEIVASYEVPALNVQHMLQHVGFNNIPFEHSTGVLSVFMNMFYPTDNVHTDTQLGYYRQREWRLIAGDLNFNGRPMGRSLSANEATTIQAIDDKFWNRELEVDGVRKTRLALALVYDPVPGWSLFDLVEGAFVPEAAMDQVRAIVGDQVSIFPAKA